jgi:hypothetical protein
VSLLGAGERAAIVLELSEEAPANSVAEAGSGRHLVFDIPLRKAVKPQHLVGPPATPLVTDVIIQPSAAAGGRGPSAHIEIATRTAVIGTVRRGPRRVYIDLAPRAPAPDGVAAAAQPRRPTSPPPTLPTSVPPPSSTSTRTPAPGGGASASPSIAARRDDSSLRDRSESLLLADARALAERPDVKGIERVRAQNVRRRQQSGASAAAPDDDPAIVEIDRYLEQARRLQLAIDARRFKEGEQGRGQ